MEWMLIQRNKSNLSYKQQKAVDLICDGYTQDEIIEELNITEREYKDNILELIFLMKV